jgi:hypothetical protein
MEIFGDFGFVGGEDTAPNPYQDRQQCINFYPELSPSKSAKTVTALLRTPGLISLYTVGPSTPGQTTSWSADGYSGWPNTWSADGYPGISADGYSPPTTTPSSIPLIAWPQPSAITNLPVRGEWVLSGSQQALVVIANTCYLATYASLATSIAQATIKLTKLGTLTTNSGPVSIRDDGLGGYAVIVDGSPNGYFYTIASQTFAQITDPNFLGSNTVGFIDGWWIFNQPGTQRFYTNAQPYAVTFNASYYAYKDAASDLLMGVIEVKEELWLIGERTTEIWYDAGGQYFPFQRLVGTMLQVGTKATASICRISTNGQDGLIWLGRSERGENIVVRTRGFAYEVVSTPAISDAIAQYPVTSDAIGYVYQEDTHEFYVLTFPTADRTWVFDASVPLEFAWHQRLSYDPYAKQYHRHRSNCYMNFAGMRIVGDYQNGTLYQLTRNAYTDAGWPIMRKRRSPVVWDKGPRQRVFMAMLQIDFAPGQGTAIGLGAAPIANLSISRDSGTTFGQKWPASLGAIGQFRNRTIWRRLSVGYNNVFDLEVIAPVNCDIVGATLKALATAANG